MGPRGNIVDKNRSNANSVETEEEQPQQPDAAQDDAESNHDTGSKKKLSAAEILKMADNLTHAEYMQYKRMQSEKFDSEQY